MIIFPSESANNPLTERPSIYLSRIMARMLTERDSIALHLNASRRHVRLVRRSRRVEMIAGIDPLIAALLSKHQLSEERVLDTQAAYDAVVASDAELDDAVRNLHDAGKQHDRAHPDSPALPDLFPSGSFGTLIDLPLNDEPNNVDALATKLELLGPDHDLAPHAAKLRAGAQAVRNALNLHGEAIRSQKSAEAEEEIAKSTLRRKYEANYLDGRKLWGRTFADRLFPDLRPARRASADAPKVVKGEFAEKSA